MKKVYEDSVVVDANDNVIGQCQMPKAYAEGKILRVAVVMVMNSKDELLVQKRGPHVIAPNYWGASAGGHVDVGEDYLDAAIRELYEEMGITAKRSELVEIFYDLDQGSDPDGKKFKRFRKEFLLRSDQEPTIDNDEVVDFKWVAIEKLKEEIDGGLDLYTYGLDVSLNTIIEYFRQ